MAHMALRWFPYGESVCSTRSNRFTERELARALRAAHRAGGVARVEVDLDGRIVLFTAKPESASGNDLDGWLARRGKDAR
jgi:hypothetical protein